MKPSTNWQNWWGERATNPDWLRWWEYKFIRVNDGRINEPLPSFNLTICGAYYDLENPSKLLTPNLNIQKLNKELRLTPLNTRNWLWLYFSNEMMYGSNWAPIYATEQEMIQAIQSIGANKLITYLKNGQIPILNNPDKGKPKVGIDLEYICFSYINRDGGIEYLRRYGQHIFEPQHRQALIDIGRFELAAIADPTKVSETVDLLLETESHKSNIEDVMASLAVYGNTDDKVRALDWYFTHKDRTFVTRIVIAAPNNWKQIVQMAINHPKFDQLKLAQVRCWGNAIERLSGEDLDLKHNDIDLAKKLRALNLGN